jgi:hypothetical protein
VQVLMNLGEPDGRGSFDSWFLYESIENRGGLQWTLAALGWNGNEVTGPIGNRDVSRRLLIKFSPDGTVSDVSLHSKECNLWGGTQDYGLGGPAKGNCPDPRGTDLIEEDAKGKAHL